MKKILSTIISLLIMLPIINVNAAGMNCYGSSEKDAIALSGDNKVKNFSCQASDTNIDMSTNLEFKHNNTSYNNYFEVTKSGKGVQIQIKDSSMKFSSDLQYGLIVITDTENNIDTAIYIKNTAYVAPTTTMTTTTTASANTKTLTVTLDPNNGTEKITKTCTLTGTNTTCSVTLPKLENENFNGWGTAKTCKEGNSGTIKVEKDTTYYACYKTNETSTTTKSSTNPLYLKTVKLTDKKTNETIDIGTFSMKKTEYTLKVLNEVENIEVTTTQDEGINVEITGNENLSVGENEIIIKLTDENNNTNEYKIVVTRLKEGETISNLHYLESLVVGGYNINFSKDKLIYSLTIPSDINRLEITAIPEEDTAMIEIKGNEDLIDGSLITINVIGEDNETTVYTIDITKETSVNYMLLVGVAIIILLIIVLIILIIIKSNKKKKNIKNDSKPQVLKEEKKETIETLNI